MSNEQNYETGGTYRLFHGSMNKFDEFSLDHKGLNGTANGFGVYLTPNKEMATMYAEQGSNGNNGFVYEVNVELEKPISMNERTITDEELSKVIDKLQESNDILNDYNDVSYYGEKVVKREVIASLSENENDVDLINDIGNTIGDHEATAKAFYDVGKYTHIIAEEQLRQKDVVIVVLQPDKVKIETIHDLNEERNSLESSEDMTDKFVGHKVSEVPIREVVIKDFEQELETTNYYDKQAWQERIEYLENMEEPVSRLALDSYINEFYDSHKEEIETKLTNLSEKLEIDKEELLGFPVDTSSTEYKKATSIMAYNGAMREIYNEIENDTFEIPPVSEEMENKILKLTNFENTTKFEME